MEEAENKVSQLTRSKTLLQSQLEELKKQLDDEVKVCDVDVKQILSLHIDKLTCVCAASVNRRSAAV